MVPYETYSFTGQSTSIRTLLVIAAANDLSFMAGDISNAFISAKSTEKIWSRAGQEFGEKCGSIVTMEKALYGMKTAPHAFHELLADSLRSIGFTPSRADQDF